HQILAHFAALAPGKGPQEAPVRRFMQIPTGHGGVHFEWWQHGKGEERVIDVAIHFETPSKEQNQQFCQFLRDHRAKIEQELGETVSCDYKWGERGAAGFSGRSQEPRTEDIARWAAEKMHKVILVAQTLIDELFRSSRHSR